MMKVSELLLMLQTEIGDGDLPVLIQIEGDLYELDSSNVKVRGIKDGSNEINPEFTIDDSETPESWALVIS